MLVSSLLQASSPSWSPGLHSASGDGTCTAGSALSTWGVQTQVRVHDTCGVRPGLGTSLLARLHQQQLPHQLRPQLLVLPHRGAQGVGRHCRRRGAGRGTWEGHIRHTQGQGGTLRGWAGTARRWQGGSTSHPGLVAASAARGAPAYGCSSLAGSWQVSGTACRTRQAAPAPAACRAPAPPTQPGPPRQRT